MRSDKEAELFLETVSKKALDYPFINKTALPRERKRPNYGSLDNYFQVDGYSNNVNTYHPLLRNNTSGNNILKTLTLSYHQLKIVSINLLSRHFSKWHSRQKL